MKQEIKERIERIRNGEVPEGYKETKVGIIPDDWLVSLTDDVAKRGTGHTPNKKFPSYYNGGIKWISLRDSNQLDNGLIFNTKIEISEEGLSNSSAVLHPKGSVLISRDAGVGKSAIMGNDMSVSQHFITWTCSNKLNNWYLYYYLQKRKSEFERMAVGSTIKTIGMPFFKKYENPLPPVKEQEKIVEILSTWNKAIELKEKLIEEKKEFKRGLMQNLLTGEIRFPEFNDEWTGISLNNLVNRITSKNEDNNKTVITISAKEGFVNQDEYFNKLVASEDLSGYFLINKGDFAYNKSYSHGYPVGAIKRLDSFEKAVVTTLYICFRIKDGKVSSNFLKYYFDSGLLNHQIKRIANEGGRAHGLLNVTPKDFFNTKVILPEYEEQEKISAILLVNEQGIQLLEQELFELKEQKRGLMQLLLTGIVKVEVN